MVVSRRSVIHFLRYSMAGGISFTCEYAVFIGLYYGLHLPVVAANTMGFLTGLAINFSLNRLWVFRRGADAVPRQFGLFATLAGCNLIITNVLLVVLKRHGVEPAIGKLLVMGLVVLWNYALYKYVIFRAPTAPDR